MHDCTFYLITKIDNLKLFKKESFRKIKEAIIDIIINGRYLIILFRINSYDASMMLDYS